VKKGKSRFVWALDDSKFLKLNEVRKLRRYGGEQRKDGLRSGKSTPVRGWFMIELGLNTGLRVSEMKDLKCVDLHLRDEQSSLSVRNGKGNKPRPVMLSEAFKKSGRWFLKWKEKQGQAVNPESYVLTTGRSKQLSKRALQKAFKKCMAGAGLPKHYSIHCLRHTYGSHLYLSSNHNLRLVQEQLGHSSVRVTEVYANLMNSDVKRAIEKLYK
jgi:site-specific recombinase XerD